MYTLLIQHSWLDNLAVNEGLPIGPHGFQGTESQKVMD